MACPRCGSGSSSDCQCAFGDSFCIEISGSGTTGDPLIPSIVINPSSDNIVECTPQGLFAKMKDRFTVPTIRKARTSAATFNNGDPITFTTLQYDYAATSMNFSTSEVVIPFAAKYRVTAYMNLDNNDGQFNTLSISADLGSGYSVISSAREEKVSANAYESFVSHGDEFGFSAGNKVRVTVGENATGSVNVIAASLVVSFVSL